MYDITSVDSYCEEAIMHRSQMHCGVLVATASPQIAKTVRHPWVGCGDHTATLRFFAHRKACGLV